MKSRLLSALFAISTATTLFASEYRPIIKCENDKVILDEVRDSKGSLQGYQVVTHGKQLINQSYVPYIVGSGSHNPTYYNNDETRVVNVRKDRLILNLLRSTDLLVEMPYGVVIGLNSTSTELVVYNKVSLGDGPTYQNFIFRNCRSVQ